MFNVTNISNKTITKSQIYSLKTLTTAIYIISLFIFYFYHIVKRSYVFFNLLTQRIKIYLWDNNLDCLQINSAIAEGYQEE